MNPVPTTCPVCADMLAVRRLHCRTCDTSIEGHFDLGRLGQLTPDQLSFVEAFVRCEGKLNRLEKELGMSYPTVRARLTEIIRALGYSVGPELEPVSDEERHRILDDLANGRLTPEEAMSMLEGEMP
ncbi:MAG: DUF2089 family protein [Anaerolineales bacterium]|nr:DUF2089 family protein [Anaerolineales bacterium]